MRIAKKIDSGAFWVDSRIPCPVGSVDLSAARTKKHFGQLESCLDLGRGQRWVGLGSGGDVLCSLQNFCGDLHS